MTILPQLKQDVLDAAAAHPPTAEPVHDQVRIRRTTRLRPRATILTAGAAAMVAAAATLIVLLGAASSPPQAYALVRNPDGTVTVTLHDLAAAIAPINAKFARLGIDETVIPITRDCTTSGIAMVGIMGGPKQSMTLTAGRRYLLPGWHGVLVAKQNPGGHVGLVLGAVQSRPPSCWPTHASRPHYQALPSEGRGAPSALTPSHSSIEREVQLLDAQALTAFQLDRPAERRTHMESRVVLAVRGEAIALATPVATPQARRVTNPVNRALVASFALLRNSRTRFSLRADASGQTALAAAIALDDSPVPPGVTAFHNVYGLDLSLAGETTIGPGRTPVWVVPGSNGACLVNLEDRKEGQVAGSVCNTTGSVDAGYLWTNDAVPYGADGSISRVLLGAAPDGNASVTVNWTGGGSTVLPVTDNIYSVPLGSHTGWTSVTLKDSSGHTVTVPGMPKLP